HFPHRDRGRRKAGIGQGADGDGDEVGKALACPIDGGTTLRAEAEGQHVAAFGRARPLRGGAGEGDLRAPEAPLIAEHGPSAPLALQAMAHGDAHGLAFDSKMELPAVADRMTPDHGWPRGTGVMPHTVAGMLAERQRAKQRALVSSGQPRTPLVSPASRQVKTLVKNARDAAAASSMLRSGAMICRDILRRART